MNSVVVKRKITTRTRSAYQAHVSSLLPKDESFANVIDLTERKLRRMADKHSDEDVRKLAARMLRDYLSGSIAIAWEGNMPIYCFLKL